jgi:enoyl-CoA hydratase/carnithine racemase
VALPQGRSELERMVDIDASPILRDGILYVASYQGRVAAYNRATGRGIWASDTSTHEDMVLSGNVLFISQSDSRVTAYDANSGALLRGRRRLPHTLANELLLTGDPIGAERLHEVGFVNAVTEPGAALESALALAERITANSPDAVAGTLGAVNTELAEVEARGWELTRAADAENAASPDRAEGVTAFFEKREPNWA